MRIRTHHDAGISIVLLEGDFLGEPEQCRLRSRIHDLAEKGDKHFIIDLTGVKHINSCGLGSLVCAYTTVRKVGGELCLSGVGKSVQTLLKITQLNCVFKVSPSVKKAISEYRRRPGC